MALTVLEAIAYTLRGRACVCAPDRGTRGEPMLPASDQLDGQFIISAQAKPPFAGWRQLHIGPLFVNLSPTTKSVQVQDAAGIQIGILIGTPIDLEQRRLVFQRHVVDAVLEETTDIDAFVENAIYRLTGSFLFILCTEKFRRIYLDANGTLSVVYDAEARVAGATAAVLLDPAEYRRRFRTRLYKALDVPNAGWFTGDLTAHVGIHRLICNHYLDLDRWTMKRHWPTAAIEASANPTATCARLFSRVTDTIEILSRTGQVSVGLTAGHDSRLLLACCRNLLDNVSFVTVNAPGADVDVGCARRLARRFKLAHALLPYREATAEDANLWQLRTGHCVGGNNVKMHPSVQPLEGKYFIGGLGGEVGRGFLWLNAEDDTGLDTRGIVSRLKLPPEDEIIEAVETWLGALPPFGTLLKLDLAYLELRMSSWGFCDSYVKPRQAEIHPMISRANYTDMLSLPPQMRRNGDIYFAQIAESWTEISQIPINRYGDFRDLLRPAVTAIKNPARAYRKAKQLAGY